MSRLLPGKSINLSVLTLATTTLLALSGCSAEPGGEGADEMEQSAEVRQAAEDTADESCDLPRTVTDLDGNEVTVDSLDSVVVTDNRAFGILNSWGVTPKAAPRAIMSKNNPWHDDENILDLGSHAEPDLDVLVEADPTIVLNGYRYAEQEEAVKKAAPDAAFVNLQSDLGPAEYSVQQVELLGEIFCKQNEAQELLEEFDQKVTETKQAYNPEMTVMGVVTSANEIRYANPVDGRGASIFFSLLDLTPALEEQGSTNHQGDDISIEAIAQSDPDFFLVMDRDAATGEGEDTTPALELIEGSASLADVTAVKKNAIYVMPADYYLTEDIYAYMDVLDGLKKAFEAQDSR